MTIHYPGTVQRNGEPYTPLKVLYPEYKWMNLSNSETGYQGLGLLTPAYVQHPLSSLIGITYYMFSAVAIANQFAERKDWLTGCQTHTKCVIPNAVIAPPNQRRPLRRLLKFLLFERYQTDLNFRETVIKAAKLEVYFDIYNDDYPYTATYFSSFYPELINGLIHCHRLQSQDAFRAYIALEKEWYKHYLLVDQIDGFLEGCEALITQEMDFIRSPFGRY